MMELIKTLLEQQPLMALFQDFSGERCNSSSKARASVQMFGV